MSARVVSLLRTLMLLVVIVLHVGCGDGGPAVRDDAAVALDAATDAALDASADAATAVPPAPSAVEASDGTYVDRVEVTWAPSAGATSYQVVRDGTPIGEVSAPPYRDVTAPGGLPTASGLAAAATSGTLADRVTLTWMAPAIGPGATGIYTVVARNAAGSSAASAADPGHRPGSPVTGYELSIDGGAYVDVGDVLTYDDGAAPPGSVSVGTASASKGSASSHVTLAATATGVDGAVRTYLLRARNEIGIGPSSAAVTGRRGAGTLTYQWERSAVDSDASYAALAGATATPFDDVAAPADGAGRFYRCVVSASGVAAPVTTAPDRGFRAAAPAVTTDALGAVTTDTLVANGALTVVGAPTPTARGLCVATTASPAVGRGGVTCQDLGPASMTGAFTHTFTGLIAGTTYHVRAYATHPTLGTVYGADVSATTVPAPPTNVAASDGTSSTQVAVTWTAVTGATGYDVYRDGALVAMDVGVPSHADAGAAAGSVPTAPTQVVATDGTRTADVRLTWTASTATDGASHLYTVRATNGFGASAASGADAGYRGAAPITRYEWSLDGTSWTSAGAASPYDDPTAPAGTITAGAAAASDGTSAEHVTLSSSGASSTAGAPRTYRVRAVNLVGSGAASATDSGHRGVGAPSYQWERSAGDSDASYAALPAATTASHDDATAPADGAGRYYRCVVAAAGATSQTTVPDRGYRHADPSDIPRDEFWIANANVRATAVADGVVYLGGDFSYVGPPTGSFAALDGTTAVPDLSRARVDGRIDAVAADGAGGYYIGGSFTSVDGVPRRGLAHLTAGGALDLAFDAGTINNSVWSVAVSGGAVYVGGDFTTIGGQARSYLVALDATTGAVTTWDPGANNTVWAVAVSGGTVYAGGQFTSIGGQARNRLAALDATTGAATSWNPGANATVRTLVISGGTVYAVGDFNSIGGQPRFFLAAVDAATGAATSWNPGANAAVWAVAVSGGTVYVGGQFTSIGGQARNRLAALDAVTGAATSWNPGANSTVRMLSVGGGTVYAGGDFEIIGGQPRFALAAVDATTGAASSWNPIAHGVVYSLTASGGTVFAAGLFTSIGGVPRAGLAALDATTGMATSWNPGANGAVNALTVSGGTVYAGGAFTSAGGQPRPSLAALDVATGLATSWNPGANGAVTTLGVSAGTVYAGGEFTTVGGQARSSLAAVDAATGAATSWNPGASSAVRALVVSGGVVYVGGDFTSVGGQLRNRVAALDATGVATSWNPGANGSVYALAVSAGVVHAAGVFTSIGGQPRSRLAALDATTGAATSWNPSPNGPVQVLAVSGDVVYAGGSFTSAGGQPRSRLAALAVTTGAATSWNPSASAVVWALATSGARVYAGGGFTTIGGQLRLCVAAFEPR